VNTHSRANVSRREVFFPTSERGDGPPGGADHIRHDIGDIGRQAEALTTVRATVGAVHAGVYLGAGSVGPAWAGTEQAVLVLGPPRSGKTSSIVVPTVLGAPGAVVSTSTKPDVLRATAAARGTVGPCLLYDPSGTVDAPRGVQRVRWSPVESCRTWDDALLVARSLVGAARPGAGARDGGAPGGADHWTERAEALLGPTLHAAALDGADLTTVLSWVDRRNAATALGILDRNGAVRPGDLLAGIAATDPREQSGIWSTASGVLSAYRSEAALHSTVAPDFDAGAFCDSSATLYICATGRHQAVAAPLVVGLLNDIRSAAYARSSTAIGDATAPQRRLTPVLLALDEVANIAPIPDLPGMVSEGAGQGLLTLACLQDLSQARSRWGAAAEGFLSLFGATVVLPGIGDVRTLEALSALAGEEEVRTRSVSAPVAGPRGLGPALSRLARGPRGMRDEQLPTVTTSAVMRRRLPVDVAARGETGMALVIDERNRMGWVRLTPWFATEPWRSAALTPGHERERGPERGPDQPGAPLPRVDAPQAGRDMGLGGL
jgi:type IV secretion system protein VirD4